MRAADPVESDSGRRTRRGRNAAGGNAKGSHELSWEPTPAGMCLRSP